jgi:hypothetical protein
MVLLAIAPTEGSTIDAEHILEMMHNLTEAAKT